MRRFGVKAAFPWRARQIRSRHRVPGSVPRGVRSPFAPGLGNRGVRSERSALAQKCCIRFTSACAAKGLHWARKCCISTSGSTARRDANSRRRAQPAKDRRAALFAQEGRVSVVVTLFNLQMAADRQACDVHSRPPEEDRCNLQGRPVPDTSLLRSSA